MRLLGSAALSACLLLAHDPVSTKLTWAQEISRIIYKRCADCHRVGGPAPMALITYEESRPWAKAIKDEVLNRRMPPWGAVKGFGEFLNDPSLTQDEMARIAEWVEGGAPEGDPTYLPPLPKATQKATFPKGKLVRRIKGPATLLGVRPLISIQSAQLILETADGSITPLLWLNNYKKAWNRMFLYRLPVVIPQGAHVTANPAIPYEYLIKQ